MTPTNEPEGVVVVDDDDGVELESQVVSGDDLPEQIERPFDPQQIKISRRVVPIDLIVRRIGFDEIELAPDFQRRARIWDVGRKSRLIESILLRIPLPVFYVAADRNENWRVVDGLQRLTTIFDFMNTESKNSFNLRGLEYLHPYENASFNNLPRSIKRRIEETELNINVIESGTPDEVMFNIFKRINTGGISLNGQEIRHALNPGPARRFLLDLASSEEFVAATDGSVSDSRMGARELVLRFSAFYMTPYGQYGNSDLDGFLNAAMKRLNEIPESDRWHIANNFRLSMIRARSLFGNDAFRKRTSAKSTRSLINRALFEAWSVPLANLSESAFGTLLSRSSDLMEMFSRELRDSQAFMSSISVATGTRSRVIERFATVENIIFRALND